MNITPGIHIDCSHLSSIDLNYRVVLFAADLGWDGGTYDLNFIESDWFDYLEGKTPSESIDRNDFEEALAYATDDAVEWLNDNRPEGFYWAIEDNSLYLWEDDNEDV